MKLSNTNLWDSKAQAILVTTNATIKRGVLEMGAGAAKQCAERYPRMPGIIAECIKEIEDRRYGCILVPVHKTQEMLVHHSVAAFIGVFQVKYDFWDKADLGLIEYSSDILKHTIKTTKLKSVAMNFPGIGFGRLPREPVLKIIKKLPDIVTVHEGEFS